MESPTSSTSSRNNCQSLDPEHRIYRRTPKMRWVGGYQCWSPIAPSCYLGRLELHQRSPSSQPRQLDRHSSLALWRYRREAYAAQFADSNDQDCLANHERVARPRTRWSRDLPAEVDDDMVLPADLILVMTPEPRLLTYQTISDKLQLSHPRFHRPYFASGRPTTTFARLFRRVRNNRTRSIYSD